MNDEDLLDLYELDDEIRGFPRIKNVPLPRNRRARHTWPKRPDLSIVTEEDDRAELKFTYRAAKSEALWLNESLGYFYQQHWFDDVLRILKGGKEASVYQCAASSTSGRPYLAAKVYRPRRFRQLKKDHIYREGRDRLDEDGNVVIDDGMNHAMNKRTGYGLQLLHTSWIEHEVQTLRILHQAGADVPQPLASGQNAILMDFIGGPDLPAPTLNTVDLSPAESRPLFERTLHNVELMLAHDRIHGDLSAYNILYWEGAITLIDFPQAISPGQNRNAFSIFQRDITRICDYFTRQGVAAKPDVLAVNLWRARGRLLTPDVHPGLLDDQDEGDLAYWQGLQEGGGS
jgi:RIO kinase 1